MVTIGKKGREVDRETMANKQTYYVECKEIPSDYFNCYKCKNIISRVGNKKRYWNPNPTARYKNICSICYGEWKDKRDEAYRKYKEYLVLEAQGKWTGDIAK